MTTSTFDSSLLIPPATLTTAPEPEISEDTLAKLQQLTEHFSDPNLELRIDETSAEKRKLDQREMMFLSRETFIRFLTGNLVLLSKYTLQGELMEGTKGDVPAAISRLEGAIAWRRSVSIEDMEAMAADCEPESRTGKNLVMGFTTAGRPIMYFFPNRNTTPVDQRRAVHAIFMLERARDLMPPGTTNVMNIFNFAGKRQGPPTSVSVARQVLHILGTHYPETLSSSNFQDMPWIVKTFVNLMWPFVDPATKKKVRFSSVDEGTLVGAGEVDKGQLLRECGGELDMPYHHETYWNALIATCALKRKEQDEAFRRGPAMVGRSENDWRSNSTSAVAASKGDTGSTHSSVD